MSEQLYRIKYSDGTYGIERTWAEVLEYLREYRTDPVYRPNPVERVVPVDDRWWLLCTHGFRAGVRSVAHTGYPLPLAQIQAFLETSDYAAPPYRLVHA